MTDSADLWKSIVTPASGDKMTALRAEHPLNFFRGRDGEGQYLFWLEVSAKGGAERTTVNLPQFSGMQVVRERISTNEWRLLLTLTDVEATAIFTALCADLLDATRHLEPGSSEAGMHTVLGRLDRWYRLFQQARDQLLSRAEQIGLAGELLFLSDVVMEHLCVLQALSSWLGPLGAAQDFVLPGAQAEVKSGDRSEVVIASEFQLDTGNAPVVLVTQVVKEDTSVDGQDTLARIVEQVQMKVRKAGSSEAMDKLTLLLYEAGYSEREEYDRSSLLLSDRSYYSVSDEFPRIDTSQTGDAISSVRYKLQLSRCEPWRISQAEAMDLLMGAV